MHYIKAREPAASFYGIGGAKMKTRGLKSLVSINRLAVMGFWEVLKKLLFFLWLEKKILQSINKIQPNKIILKPKLEDGSLLFKLRYKPDFLSKDQTFIKIFLSRYF